MPPAVKRGSESRCIGHSEAGLLGDVVDTVGIEVMGGLRLGSFLDRPRQSSAGRWMKIKGGFRRIW